jgi:hypothetical protein
MALSPRLLRPRAAGGFDPRTIAGLSIWLDGNDSTTILNSVSPDTPATVGQTVRSWLDKSGNGRHAEQTVGANQPTLASGGFVEFDGTNDILMLTNIASMTRNIGYLATFMAYRPTTIQAGNVAAFQFSTNAGMPFVRATAGYATGPVFRLSARRLDGDSQQQVVASSNVPTAGVKYVQAAIFHYANAAASLRVNGTQVGSSSSFHVAGNTSDTNSQGAAVGGIPNTSTDAFQASNIGIQEVVVYVGTVLNSGQVNAIERYLARKWGVSI